MMTNPILPPAALLPWREWYATRRWRKRRRWQLHMSPLCAICLTRGITTPATIADHVESHHGDWNKFLLGELQSLCELCHNSSKRRLVERGFSADIGADGWPIDPRHPANQ
jgi:hypothetical protein